MRLVQVGHSYKDAAKHLGVEVGIVGQWWFRESDEFKKQKNTSDKGKVVYCCASGCAHSILGLCNLKVREGQKNSIKPILMSM